MKDAIETEFSKKKAKTHTQCMLFRYCLLIVLRSRFILEIDCLNSLISEAVSIELIINIVKTPLTCN